MLCVWWREGRGYIHKVAQWRDVSGSVQFLTVAILKPFRRLVQPIWRMILHSPPPMNVRVCCLLFAYCVQFNAVNHKITSSWQYL